MKLILSLILLVCSGCNATKPRAHVVAVPGYYAAGVTFTVGSASTKGVGDITESELLEAYIRAGLVRQGVKVQAGDVRLVIDPVEAPQRDAKVPFWKEHPYWTAGGGLTAVGILYGIYENNKDANATGGVIPGDFVGGNVSDDRVCPFDFRGAKILVEKGGWFGIYCSENNPVVE